MSRHRLLLLGVVPAIQWVRRASLPKNGKSDPIAGEEGIDIIYTAVCQRRCDSSTTCRLCECLSTHQLSLVLRANPMAYLTSIVFQTCAHTTIRHRGSSWRGHVWINYHKLVRRFTTFSKFYNANWVLNIVHIRTKHQTRNCLMYPPCTIDSDH